VARGTRIITPVSKIKKLYLKEFREFNDTTLHLGSKLTAIAGHNCTGKSTLLAILANSSEYKKMDGAPLIKPLFRADFSDIFKASPLNDPSASNVFTITFGKSDDTDIDVPFRKGWWENGTRFRLLPKITETSTDGKERTSEAKMSWPVLFLGLSRLYPLGECSGAPKQRKMSNDEKSAWVLEKKAYILSLKNLKSTELLSHPDLKSKIFVGDTTDKYDATCNSTGQDNLGQILFALLSFKKLKEYRLRKNLTWHGGLLLIDELDASLHPSAQIRLLDVLHEVASEINLQIIFTTHSLSLLKYYTQRKFLREGDQNKIIYLTTSNGALQCQQDLSYDDIEADMLISNPADFKFPSIITYTEDEEARYFLQAIVAPPLLEKLSLVDLSLSKDTLAKLFKESPEHFEKVLLILDGDATNIKSTYNILKLPGDGQSPEQLIYSYVTSLSAGHDIWKKLPSFKKRSIIDHGPESPVYNNLEKPRERFKNWFNDTKDALDAVDAMSYWRNDNKKIIQNFNTELTKSLKALYGRSNIPFN